MNTVRSSRKPIFIGFGLMLILLLSMGVLGLNYMSDMQNRLDNIVHVHNQRTEYYNNMRNIARERSLLLYQMNLKRDFFFTDEAKIRMSNLAGDFIGIRQQLQLIPSINDKDANLEDIMPDVIYSTSIQSEVIKLLEDERYDEADELLSTKSIPTQNALMIKYDNFVINEQRQARLAAAEAARHYQLSLYSMTTLGALLLGLGLFTSVYVIRRVSEAESSLRDLNSELEERVSQRTHNLSLTNKQLANTLDQLQNAQSQLVQSEKMASLGSLVAGISHEVNTPIGIAMTAITHQQEQSSELQQQYTAGNMKRSRLEKFITDNIQTNELIANNLRRATDLIASFKRVAVDQSHEHWELINLHDYIDSTILSLHPKFKHSRIKINNNCPGELHIFTNPGAIYQIISNLMLNSLFHGFSADQDGLINIDCQQKQDFILLSYTDNGRGMSSEVQHRAFDPFYTTKRGQGGSGLGLHLVYNLVTSGLNGNITIDSQPEKGTQFHIELPLRKADTGETKP